MAEENTEIVETVEVGSPETVVEEIDAPETLDAEVITEDETAEETVEGEKDGEEPETAEEEITAELPPIVFEEADELPQVIEKIDQLSAKYELPDEVTAAIATLRARAEANTLEAFSDYGDVETVKGILEVHNTLHTPRPIKDEVTGVVNYRPNTDKFVEDLNRTAPDKVDWLVYDTMALPSRKYQGLTKLQEINADSLAVEGDTLGTLMKRFEVWQEAVKTNAIVPASDIPIFIPKELHDAFRQLDKESRAEYELLDPIYDDPDDSTNHRNRVRKLDELARQQRGIDADRAEDQKRTDAINAEHQALVAKTVKAQETFYDESQKVFFERLKKDVVFSDDPKLQVFEAGKLMTTLKQAFFTDVDGEFARQILAESGVKFDFEKARSMVEEINNAAIALTDAGRYTDDKGNPINPVAVNRAAREFAEKGWTWRTFADDILKQLSNTTKTGKAETLATEVKKIKVQPKARAVAKSTTASPPSANKSKAESLSIYDPAYNGAWADESIEARLQDEAKKTRAYS